MKDSVMKGRTIALDTETTGMNPLTERLIEVAAVEMIDGEVTGKVFHELIDPEKAVEAGAEKVHGWDTESIRHELKTGKQYPKYKEVYEQLRETQKFHHIADRLKEFIGDSVVHAHNAPFDKGFLDMEFERLGQPKLSEAVKFHCTLKSASAIRPRRQNTLDILAKLYGLKTDSYGGLEGNSHVTEQFKSVCKDLGIDPTDRDEHAALKDTLILCHVARNLMSPENELILRGGENETDEMNVARVHKRRVAGGDRPILVPANAEESQAHRKLMERIGKESGKDISPSF